MIEVIDRLVSADEAGHILGLKPATVRRLTAMGELPSVRPTGRRAVRYRLRDLQDLVRMRSHPMRTPSTPSGARDAQQPEDAS
jgi:excisionase family DNA binding protein